LQDPANVAKQEEAAREKHALDITKQEYKTEEDKQILG